MNIVLGVSGGIAAYKAVALARLFVEGGHEVRVVPTEQALQFVGAPTWEAISGHPVTHKVNEGAAGVQHVRLGQQADIVLVAPATANTIAKLAAGIADDLLGNTVLTTRAPLMIAPAMHTEMWEHPATQHNIGVLRERGAVIVGPESGRLTGADSGAGRMSEPARIFAEALSLIETPGGQTGDLTGLRFAISAGGTREPIDPVRFIGNRSSGRQGVALALAAAERGAQVDLISANVDDSVLAEAKTLKQISVTSVSSTAELETAMATAASDADAIIMTAAVADFRPKAVQDVKIKKTELSEAAPTIELVQNPDILAGLVARRSDGQLLVGFAAETEADETKLTELGRAKLRRKGADLLVVNRVGWGIGFESGMNTVQILNRNETTVHRASGSKREVADAVLDTVLNAMLDAQRSTRN